MFSDELSNAIAVSTHSRLKAAGDAGGRMATSKPSFNTQPPEGGWKVGQVIPPHSVRFQHTAA